MIAIVSNVGRERSAFATLCESHGWTAVDSDSVLGLIRLLRRWKPRVVLVRHKLGDGYSDNVIAALSAANLLPATKVIVLLAAGTSSAIEARQLALGGDCVLRDPVHTDVLVEYLGKYMQAPAIRPTNLRRKLMPPIHFAGATLNVADRALVRGKQTAALTPREVELVELLARSCGEVVSYEMLYSEILGRKFQGETSNMRVLLGKLVASANTIGIAVRAWVQVIPKLGYRYAVARSGESLAPQSRPTGRSRT